MFTLNTQLHLRTTCCCVLSSSPVWDTISLSIRRAPLHCLVWARARVCTKPINRGRARNHAGKLKLKVGEGWVGGLRAKNTLFKKYNPPVKSSDTFLNAMLFLHFLLPSGYTYIPGVWLFQGYFIFASIQKKFLHGSKSWVLDAPDRGGATLLAWGV